METTTKEKEKRTARPVRVNALVKYTELVERELKPETVEFWGKTYENIKPELSSFVWGDGQRVIQIVPLNTRPHYFIARIDSTYPQTEAECDKFVDEVIDYLEEEFGQVDEDDRAFPLVNIDAGYTWNILAECT